MKWPKSIFAQRYAWDYPSVRTRLRPLKFRVATPEDFSICVSLHEQNEAHGVPSNVRRDYAQALLDGNMLVLMVESEQRTVATCALSRVNDSQTILCYGLVAPNLHRTGIGTAMFMARLSLLPAELQSQELVISALETSLTFYRQFGFRLIGRFNHPDGNRYPVATLSNISSAMVHSCRIALKEAGVVVPNVGDQIPQTQVQPPSAKRTS